MAVSYNKLRKKLIDLGMCKGELRVKAGVSTGRLGRLGQLGGLENENVGSDVFVRVCQALECNVDEIMDVSEPTEEK